MATTMKQDHCIYCYYFRKWFSWDETRILRQSKGSWFHRTINHMARAVCFAPRHLGFRSLSTARSHVKYQQTGQNQDDENTISGILDDDWKAYKEQKKKQDDRNRFVSFNDTCPTGRWQSNFTDMEMTSESSSMLRDDGSALVGVQAKLDQFPLMRMVMSLEYGIYFGNKSKWLNAWPFRQPTFSCTLARTSLPTFLFFSTPLPKATRQCECTLACLHSRANLTRRMVRTKYLFRFLAGNEHGPTHEFVRAKQCM